MSDQKKIRLRVMFDIGVPERDKEKAAKALKDATDNLNGFAMDVVLAEVGITDFARDLGPAHSHEHDSSNDYCGVCADARKFNNLARLASNINY